MYARRRTVGGLSNTKFMETAPTAHDGETTCQVVDAGDVAAVRAITPHAALVALVDADDSESAIDAQLAGADVVVPVRGDVDESTLSAAMDAARAIATRRDQATNANRRAAHELGTAYLSVGMIAELIGGANRARGDQLRRLASEGATLAWRAARPSRAPVSLRLVDIVDALGELADSPSHAVSGPVVEVCGADAAMAIVNPADFATAIQHIISNSTIAGATTVSIEVRDSGSHVEIAVVDDGYGPPVGIELDDLVQPFFSGWPQSQDGLGLTMATEFAESGGGDLRLSARADARGMMVVMRLPRAHRNSPGNGERATRRSPVVDPLRAQAEILETIARREPVSQSLDLVVRAMQTQLPGSICSILLLDPVNGTLSHGAGTDLPPPYRRFIDGVSIGPTAGSCGVAAYSRAPVVATDISTDDRWVDYRAVALQHGLRSCWSTPILDADGGQVLGTFAVYHDHPWLPTHEAAELVDRFTYIASIAIGTHTLFSRLQESESRFRSAFAGAGVGMAVMNLDGVLQEINPTLEAMLGAQATGRYLSEFLGADDIGVVRSMVAQAVQDARGGKGGTFRLSDVQVCPAGEPTSLVRAAMSGSIVMSHEGQPVHFCVELFDLTERHRMVQAEHEQAVAEAASKAKTDLLALVSHEIRTPLNAVIGFAQLMQLETLSTQRRAEGVEHILASGRHLMQLINDLVDLSGAETGQLELRTEAVRSVNVIADSVEIVAGLAETKEIAIVVRTAAPHSWVRADPYRLRQVLINIIGNAVKFTPPGGRVEISTELGAIKISDSGPGIDPDDMADLFVPFRRLGARRSEGSGLGLALSHQLMRAMDGHLDVDSAPGAGATFWVRLPPASLGIAGTDDQIVDFDHQA